jgi:hypothetical protein
LFVPTTLCHTCCCFIAFASARPRIPSALPALKPASPPIFLRLHRDPWGLIFRVSPQTIVELFPSQLGNTTPSSLEHYSSKQQHRRKVCCVFPSVLQGNTYLRQATGSIAGKSDHLLAFRLSADAHSCPSHESASTATPRGYFPPSPDHSPATATVLHAASRSHETSSPDCVAHRFVCPCTFPVAFPVRGPCIGADQGLSALLCLFIYARKPIYFPPLAGFSCSGTSCEHQHSINIIRFSATGRSNSQLLENE